MGKSLLEGNQTGPFRRHQWKNGDTQVFRKQRHVDDRAAFFHQVDHVEPQKHGQAELEKLGDQVKVPFKIGRVDDCQNRVRSRRVRLTAEKDVP